MKNLLLLLILSAILFISCEEKQYPEEKKTQEAKQAFNVSEMPFIVSNPWMRPGAINRNTAAFMKITNNTERDDTLYSVQSDLAKVTQLHETYEKENDMMGMRHVDYLVIPSKSIVELKPGSFHIMLIGLNKDLSNGDLGKLKLSFKNSGELELSVTVRTNNK